ncbi:MAG TPA: DUF2314 domain-containing protein [Povalibacter sp.]|nr:DUF2314 domain-containing protein [Povalibacter sp.]
MNHRRKLAILLAAAFACSSPASAEEMPLEFTEAVANAERLGQALLAADAAGEAVDRMTLAEIARQGAELCEFAYRLVHVDDNGRDVRYLIARAKSDSDVVIGRHFAWIADTVQSSTRSCLNLGTPGRGVVAMTVTHLLSPTPNEFHVYEALKHRIPLLVLTSAGIWSVTEGTITFEGRGEEQPSAAAPQLSPNAPQDKELQAVDAEQIEKMHKAMQIYVDEARRTYPAAKARFLKGLPRGENFFLTTRLHDQQGRTEQVFIAVQSIDGSLVRGSIYNEINTVEGYAFGQSYSFPESEIIDWLITKPDGREEGNLVGKFLDTYEPAP